MFYDATRNDHGLRHNPMKALIGPRPIGWISALNAKGELNLSPYSFFNAVAESPVVVAFSSNGYKDAVAFVDETKEFVCNLATYDTREAMNLTSAPLPRGQSELAFAGLTAAPCNLVKAPRVAEAPAALECQWLRTIQLEDRDGRKMDQYLVLGQVIGVHIDDRFIKDGLVDTAAMRPIMRSGYMDYFVATPETKFSIQRPKGA
ncbi:MAG: flavin reductase [Enterovirga sp.]|jgi:flavin reductase (DIM6/NTAB) family NADH-FMN oxidoreductase RutF|nr:flavin reductase [Enterovirga sp.]